jgi:hypothetical protein
MPRKIIYAFKNKAKPIEILSLDEMYKKPDIPNVPTDPVIIPVVVEENKDNKKNTKQ